MSAKEAEIEKLRNRIDELEQRLEFQDEVVGQLSEQLGRHQQDFFDLDKKFDLLIQRLRSNDDEHDPMDPRDEPPPPHY